jgi:hypothetical protein
MKSKTLTQPAIQTMARVPSGGVDKVSPNASAIVGVTLMGDFDDVLAVLRTAVLLAKNMKAPLSLDLLGRDILPGNFDDTPYSKLVSELLDSARAQLGLLAASVFAMEVNVVAASFISAGSITMRIRTANSVLGRQQA